MSVHNKSNTSKSKKFKSTINKNKIQSSFDDAYSEKGLYKDITSSSNLIELSTIIDHSKNIDVSLKDSKVLKYNISDINTSKSNISKPLLPVPEENPLIMEEGFDFKSKKSIKSKQSKVTDEHSLNSDLISSNGESKKGFVKKNRKSKDRKSKKWDDDYN